MAESKKDPAPAIAPLKDVVVAQVTCVGALIPVVALPEGYGLLPIGISKAQTGTFIGQGKTKTQDLINRGELEIAKVDGRTIVLTSSAIALIERNRVRRDR